MILVECYFKRTLDGNTCSIIYGGGREFKFKIELSKVHKMFILNVKIHQNFIYSVAL